MDDGEWSRKLPLPIPSSTKELQWEDRRGGMGGEGKTKREMSNENIPKMGGQIGKLWEKGNAGGSEGIIAGKNIF